MKARKNANNAESSDARPRGRPLYRLATQGGDRRHRLLGFMMAEFSQFSGKGALSVKEFLKWSTIGRTKALEEIGSRRLRAVKVGRRLLIPIEAAIDWLDAQPLAGAKGQSSVSSKSAEIAAHQH